ncbi:MAG: proline dioxygenase [Rhodocyclales bacterium]|nr:proline dioxygenase [Rhodocyclales bacterium]
MTAMKLSRRPDRLRAIMGIIVNFAPKLGVWILHNLDRGCAVENIVAGMVAQNFEAAMARGLVQAFRHARSEGAEPPTDSIELDGATADMLVEYRYETPRLATGPSILAVDRQISVLIRLEQPILAVLEGVLSADECMQLIALSRPRLRPSTIVDPVTGEDRIAEHRDSEGMFFAPRETPFIATLTGQQLNAEGNRRGTASR